jgi:hypothetical protein
MWIAKFVIGMGTLILLGIAIWMHAAHFSVHGDLDDGTREINTLTSGGVFFIAILFAAMYVTVVIIDRRQKRR